MGSKRLNLIQVTTHDSGRYLGCYGHSTIRTPNIDNMAEKGVKFDNYFATVPICCASRASMLTGRYPQSHGLMDLCFPPFNWRIKDREKHLSQILKAAGYYTVLFHVQHEVVQDEIERLEFSDIRSQNHPPCDRVAEEVEGFLLKESLQNEPFYAQVGFFETHTPFDWHGTKPDNLNGVEIPPFLADDAASREAMAGFQGSVNKVDNAVGRIIAALKKSGLEENTLMVFTTDHGIEIPRSKWTLYDSGTGIALVMRCPALSLTKGKTYSQLLSNVDYLPTILELLEIPAPKAVQGKSFAGVFEEENSPGRDAVFSLYYKTHSRSVRTKKFKLIRHFEAVGQDIIPVSFHTVLRKRGAPKVELYNLEKDPFELDNLSGQSEYGEIRLKLDNMLWKWMESVRDPLLKGPEPSPFYRMAMRDYHQWKRRKS